MKADKILKEFGCSAYQRRNPRLEGKFVCGYYNFDTNEIIWDGNNSTLWHEIGHLIYWNCIDKSGENGKDGEIFAYSLEIMYSFEFNYFNWEYIIEQAINLLKNDEEYYSEYYGEHWKRNIDNFQLSQELKTFVEYIIEKGI
jgi:hypothetical protein